MLRFKVNGKPTKVKDLAEEIKRAAEAKFIEIFRARLSAIRHPETGEFATVLVEADSLEHMAFRVEGSAALLEIVRSHLAPEEKEAVTFVETIAVDGPKAFLSYGWEDRVLAKKIAEGLQASGIDVWWAEWEIRAGDSIRRKIDSGLGNCTHFIVLLSPTSIVKAWVNEEIDAGYMRKVRASSRFIPLRYGLAVEELPPLMSGVLSPEVDAEALDLSQLIADIHSISRKPVLGAAPGAVSVPKIGYSAAATAVAQVFVITSKDGMSGDPQLTVDTIVEKTGLTFDDVIDALHEIGARVNLDRNHVRPKHNLYAEFDRYWQPWDPAVDALRLGADLLNDPQFPVVPADIAARYKWQARRLNPAIAYLVERDAVKIVQTLGSAPYIATRIWKTDATRRFVKSRS